MKLQKLKSVSYMIILLAAIVIVVLLYTFRNNIRKSLTESMGSGEKYEKIDPEKVNRECQSAYLDSVRAVLTGPSVDETNGYVSNKDALKQVNAVKNTCRWDTKTPIEKKYQKFQATLANTSDENQINNLLIAIS